MSKSHRPRILIVGAQHGDERLGPRLQRFMKNDVSGRYASVDYLCGNPRAYRRNVRFTETDLNRSYGVETPRTYEEKRARKIMQRITNGNYDFVLDIHTSRADVGQLLLAAHLESPVLRIIGASDIDRIAIMPVHIAACSLIGAVPQAVSVEYARDIAHTRKALHEVMCLIDNLLAGKTAVREREVYRVADTIPSNTKLSANDKNFAMSSQGFYPIIYRSSGGSYKTYKGFAAPTREIRYI